MDDTKVNILLVDDNPANLLTLSAVLSNPSYNLIRANSSQEALSYLLKMEFAVILVDVMMPGMDGFALAHLVKSREATRHIPIIFMTSIATDVQYIFKGYSIGAVDYIQKPFEPAIVKSKVAVFADLFQKNRLIRNSEKAEFLRKEQLGRIRAEQAESRYRDLTNSLDHAIIWESNLDLSLFSFVSGRVERLLGYPTERWTSETDFFLSLIPKDDQMDVLKVLHRLQHPTDPLGERCEHRLVSADGIERWFHTAIQIYRNEQNIALGLRGLSVDIQSLKTVELALRDSQERLDFALRASLLGMWDWNLITGNFLASDTLQLMFGYNSFDFPNTIEAMRTRMLPEDREKHIQLINKAMKIPEYYELEYRIKLPDGQIRWIYSKGKSFFNSQQKAVRISGTVMDITSKKEIEEKERFLSEITLELSRTLDFQTNLRRISELLVPKFACWCIIDLIEDNSIRRTIVNHRDPSLSQIVKKFESLQTDLDAPSGASKAIRSGKSVLFPPESLDDLSENFYEIPMIGTRDPEQIKIIQTLGIRSYISVPIKLRDISLGIITLVRSTTMPVFKEKDLRLFEETARRLALAIDNSRLYHEAQKAIKVKGDLVSFVSHDLKNPLSAITLNARLLEKSLVFNGKDERIKKTLERILNSSQKMENLIKNILDLAKIEAGGISLNLNSVNINSIIHDVVDISYLQARQKSIQVETEIDSSIVNIYSDSESIFRALTNLVSNAIKFTPENGKIKITVKPSGEDVIFSVKDSGPGIPTDQQNQVFERFWQDKPTAHKGTGLGLTIVKEIVEAHKGHIWFESKMGEGTTFYFKLPRTLIEAA